MCSDRIKPITGCKLIPLPSEAVKAFESIQKMVEEPVVAAMDNCLPFEVETDASDVASVATLNQN